MQDRPDKLALLGAIARFLEHDVRPALKDPGLNFRALIAAHLAGTIAAEVRAEDALIASELRRLRALLPDAAVAGAGSHSTSGAPGPGKPALRPGPPEERLRLRAELARRIRERLLDEEQRRRVFEHVMQTLREDLEVYQPKFDTSLDAD